MTPKEFFKKLFDPNDTWYAATYYLVLGVCFLIFALARVMNWGVLVADPWPGMGYWVTLNTLTGLSAVTVGIGVLRRSKWLEKHRFLRYVALGIPIFNLMFRTVSTAVAIGGANLSAAWLSIFYTLVVSFLLGWVAPFLWHLPTDVSDYYSLRSKLGRAVTTIKSMQVEIDELRRQEAAPSDSADADDSGSGVTPT